MLCRIIVLRHFRKRFSNKWLPLPSPCLYEEVCLHQHQPLDAGAQRLEFDVGQKITQLRSSRGQGKSRHSFQQMGPPGTFEEEYGSEREVPIVQQLCRPIQKYVLARFIQEIRHKVHLASYGQRVGTVDPLNDATYVFDRTHQAGKLLVCYRMRIL